jgi:hypothetical protein
VRQQPEVLEDHRGAVAAQFAQARLVHGADVLTVDRERPGGRLDEAREAAYERGLARAGQAHHDEDLALADLEAHVADSGGAAGTGAQFGGVQRAGFRVPGMRSAFGPKTFHRPSTEKTGSTVVVSVVLAGVDVAITRHPRSGRRTSPRP